MSHRSSPTSPAGRRSRSTDRPRWFVPDPIGIVSGVPTPTGEWVLSSIPDVCRGRVRRPACRWADAERERPGSDGLSTVSAPTEPADRLSPPPGCHVGERSRHGCRARSREQYSDVRSPARSTARTRIPVRCHHSRMVPRTSENTEAAATDDAPTAASEDPITREQCSDSSVRYAGRPPVRIRAGRGSRVTVGTRGARPTRPEGTRRRGRTARR